MLCVKLRIKKKVRQYVAPQKVGNIRQWIFSLLRHQILYDVIIHPTILAGEYWKQQPRWSYMYVPNGM